MSNPYFDEDKLIVHPHLSDFYSERHNKITEVTEALVEQLERNEITVPGSVALSGNTRKHLRDIATQQVNDSYAEAERAYEAAQEKLADFVKQKEDEIFEGYPSKLKAILSYMAYEDGHAYGHSEVLNIASGLANDFESVRVLFTNLSKAANRNDIEEVKKLLTEMGV